MTLLITLIAAVIITIVWYTSPKARKQSGADVLYVLGRIYNVARGRTF